jgi:hypothetical protein
VEVQPRDLLDKYIEMHALRCLDASGELVDPKPRMRALAKRFPGALREIDELPLEIIQSRIATLRESDSSPEKQPEKWVLAMLRFHVAMSDVLAIKRILGRREITPALRAAAERVSSAWDLDRIARPPAGKLTALVFEHIAKSMGIDAEEARELVFGKPTKI